MSHANTAPFELREIEMVEGEEGKSFQQAKSVCIIHIFSRQGLGGVMGCDDASLLATVRATVCLSPR